MFSLNRALVWMLCGGAVLPILACPLKVNVAISPGSTVEDLTFLVSSQLWKRPVALPMFTVGSCISGSDTSRLVFWRMEATPQAIAVRRVKYGTAPVGYATTLAPKKLESRDCYEVSYSGADEIYFSVDQLGKVASIPQPTRPH